MIKCDDLETSTESMEKNEQSHFDSDVKNNLIPLQVTKKKILLEENSSAVEEESLQSKESTKIEGLKLLFFMSNQQIRLWQIHNLTTYLCVNE